MSKCVLACFAALVILAFVMFEMYRAKKRLAAEYKDMYEEARKTNEALKLVIKKINAEGKIREARRCESDEKIDKAHRGTARERFDAITDGLSDGGQVSAEAAGDSA